LYVGIIALIYTSALAHETQSKKKQALHPIPSEGWNADLFSSGGTGEPFLEFDGFLESRIGIRTQNDPNQKDISIGELRLQLETEKDFDNFSLNLVADFIFDPVLDIYTPDLESGEGAIDLRQVNVQFYPLDFMDIKIGRQILTWGTGDLVFINDLFAKDWNSFLVGRDVEYLKAPTDAIKISAFFDTFNIDLVYVPKFGADRFIDGKRISFFDKNLNSRRGRDNPLVVDRPDEWFEDDELSMRLFRSFGAYEAAFYFYSGFWKSPAGQKNGGDTFPALDVYGASLRGPVIGGIGYVETGYYRSGAATNSLIRNSEMRYLVGYEREIATELTAVIQYNLEHKLGYEDYVRSLSAGAMNTVR